MPTQIKIDQVADLKQRFAEANSIFITDYAGLTVEQITKLRKELRQKGIKYVVAKNTLMKIAAKDAGYDDMEQFFNGPTAVAFAVTEPNVPAKILYDACKEFKEKNKPEIKAFYIDRQRYSHADAERIAQLPSREILLSQLIATIEGPIASLVGTLDAMIRELIGTIDAVAEHKGSQKE